MTGKTKVIKVYESFILGKCQCGCDENIKIITSTWEKGIGHLLQRYKSGHNPIDHSKINFPTREDHHNWKGGRILIGIKRKYIAIRRKHHPFCNPMGYVFEHRYRMELILGRYLTEEEVVHHIDGNGYNNDESNLMLFATHSEHMTYERTKDMTGRNCKICGSKKTQMKKRKGKLQAQWYGNENDGFVCRTCHNRDYVRNKKLNNPLENIPCDTND